MSVQSEASDRSLGSTLQKQSTQVFENLAKKLHRLESKLGTWVGWLYSIDLVVQYYVLRWVAMWLQWNKEWKKSRRSQITRILFTLWVEE